MEKVGKAPVGRGNQTQQDASISACPNCLTAGIIGFSNVSEPTERQKDILKFIKTHRLCTVAEICVAFDINQSTASEHLKALMELGFVVKRPMPGKVRRLNLWSATETVTT